MIALWIVVVVALALIGRAAGDQTSDNLSLPGTGSTKATTCSRSGCPTRPTAATRWCCKAASGKLTDSKNKKAVDDTVDVAQARRRT